MDTVLVANVPHYHYLAQALCQAGYLRQYITSISLSAEGRPPFFLSKDWQARLECRRLLGIPQSHVRQLWLPELLQRALPAAGICTIEQGHSVNNYLFDKCACGSIDGDCRILHFISDVGLRCAYRARQFGATIVCDVRQAHPAELEEVLSVEGYRHGCVLNVPGNSRKAKVLAALAVTDFVVVPSEYTKKTYLNAGVQNDRIQVIPYGVDTSVFRQRITQKTCFTVLYVGQITFLKGVEYLLEAFRSLRLLGSRLVLIGQIDDQFRPVLKRYEGSFEHRAPVPKTQLVGYYSSSSVLVLPSLSDSFGLVVFEAMACGLPVVVSHNTGACDMLEDGNQGFVVPPRDVDSLKEKLRFLHDNPDVGVEMGRFGHLRSLNVSWRRYGERSLKFYREVIGCDGGTRQGIDVAS